MHRFWDTIIEPLLRTLNARRILEVGSDAGDNTRRLLDYCREVDGFLEVVDPLPKYDPETWFESWPGRVGFHRDLSLNVLSKIKPVEVALIDGDHNWYTVYHELKLIDKAARQAQAPFPLVLLHDVGWPYGRRDLYYDPDTIPLAYRKPWRRLGMRPGTPELAEEGGLNPHLCNSIYEHDYQNGVLTAVEDFVAQSRVKLRLETLPGINGLGILYPVALADEAAFAEWLDALRPSPSQRALIETIEQDRLANVVRASEQSRDLNRRRDELAHLSERLAEHEAQARAQETRADQLDAQLAECRREQEAQTRAQAVLADRVEDSEALRLELADRLAHSEQMRASLLDRVRELENTPRVDLEAGRVADELREQLQTLRQKHSAACNDKAKLQQQLVEQKEARAALRQQLEKQKDARAALQQRFEEQREARASLQQQLAEQKDARAALQQRFDEQREAHASLQQQLAEQKEARANLQRRFDEQRDARAALERLMVRYRSALAEFERDLNAIRASARWRFGHRLARVFEVLLLRGRPPLLIDRLSANLAGARQWKPK